MKQETREAVWQAAFWLGWAAAGLIAALRVTEQVGAEWGALSILFIGVSIAAAVHLSRMKLTETMIAVYRAGIESARVQEAERQESERG